jgi:hypothetical protein
MSSYSYNGHGDVVAFMLFMGYGLPLLVGLLFWALTGFEVGDDAFVASTMCGVVFTWILYIFIAICYGIFDAIRNWVIAIRTWVTGK